MDFKHFCKNISSLAEEIAEYFYNKILSGNEFNDKYTNILTIDEIRKYNKYIEENSIYIHQFLYNHNIKYQLFYRNNYEKILISNDISKLNRSEFDHIYTDNIIIHCPKNILITDDFKDGKRIRYDNCRIDDYPRRISNGKLFNEENYLSKFSEKINEIMKLLLQIKDKQLIPSIKRAMDNNNYEDKNYKYTKLLLDVILEIIVKCKEFKSKNDTIINSTDN